MFLDNYDEFDLCYDLTKIPNYTLPDPLISSNGKKIQSRNEWFEIRRKELINLSSLLELLKRQQQ